MSKPREMSLQEEADAATDEEANAETPPGSPGGKQPSPAEQAASKAAYEARVNRAKQNVGKLDLKNLALEAELPKGDHQLTHREDNLVHTPRAADEKTVLTVRGAPKHKGRLLMQIGPEVLGSGKVFCAWQPGGQRLAVASWHDGKTEVHCFTRSGQAVASYELCDSKPLWTGWDCNGEVVAVRTEAAGIFLWEVGLVSNPSPPLHLAPAHTSKATFCKWSKLCPQLAIGTSDGKVILYNRLDAVLQLHERKGTLREEVTCGDWLFDNRLALASGQRVKISQPIAETKAKWESFSKFKLSGLGSKIPKHIQESGAPAALAFTLGYPPFVAVTLGGKYLLVFDSTRKAEDIGLTFPPDYGYICAFEWLPGNMLLVALSNGYIVTVDFAALLRMQQGGKLPPKVAAMATNRLFNEYITSMDTTPDQKIVCCGDAVIKIVRNSGVDLEVFAEIPLDRKPVIGECLHSVSWDSEGSAFACASTDGYVYVYALD